MIFSGRERCAIQEALHEPDSLCSKAWWLLSGLLEAVGNGNLVFIVYLVWPRDKEPKTTTSRLLLESKNADILYEAREACMRP